MIFLTLYLIGYVIILYPLTWLIAGDALDSFQDRRNINNDAWVIGTAIGAMLAFFWPVIIIVAILFRFSRAITNRAARKVQTTRDEALNDKR